MPRALGLGHRRQAPPLRADHALPQQVAPENDRNRDAAKQFQKWLP